MKMRKETREKRETGGKQIYGDCNILNEGNSKTTTITESHIRD